MGKLSSKLGKCPKVAQWSTFVGCFSFIFSFVGGNIIAPAFIALWWCCVPSALLCLVCNSMTVQGRKQTYLWGWSLDLTFPTLPFLVYCLYSETRRVRGLQMRFSLSSPPCFRLVAAATTQRHRMNSIARPRLEWPTNPTITPSSSHELHRSLPCSLLLSPALEEAMYYSLTCPARWPASLPSHLPALPGSCLSCNNYLLFASWRDLHADHSTFYGTSFPLQVSLQKASKTP